MRLLILTHHYAPEFSGDAIMQSELARHVVAQGHKATVVTNFPHHHMVTESGARLASHSTEEGVEVIRLRTPALARKNLLLRAIQETVTEAQFLLRSLFLPAHDVVVVWSPPITLPLLAAVLRLRGTRLLPFMQDAFPELLVSMGIANRRSLTLRVGEWAESLAYRLSDYIAVHSPRNRAHVIEHKGHPGKTHVWPMWLDADAVVPCPRDNSFRQAHWRPDQFVVLYSGTVGYAMGWETVARAAELLVSREDIQFGVAGDGPHLDALQSFVKTRGLRNLKLLPLQTPEKLPEMLGSADALLVSLRRELGENKNGYFRAVIPHKTLTAMAAGRPIIASAEAESDLAQLVRISDTGMIAPAQDAQALADVVLSMQANPGKCAEWAANARRFACRHFSIGAQLPVITGILEDLSRGKVTGCENPWTAAESDVVSQY